MGPVQNPGFTVPLLSRHLERCEACRWFQPRSPWIRIQNEKSKRNDVGCVIASAAGTRGCSQLQVVRRHAGRITRPMKSPTRIETTNQAAKPRTKICMRVSCRPPGLAAVGSRAHDRRWPRDRQSSAAKRPPGAANRCSRRQTAVNALQLNRRRALSWFRHSCPPP